MRKLQAVASTEYQGAESQTLSSQDVADLFVRLKTVGDAAKAHGPGRTETSVATLCPEHTVLADIARLTSANSDLPVSAAVFPALAMIGAALAQNDFRVALSSGPAYPNLGFTIVTRRGVDTPFALEGIVRPILSASRIYVLPAALSSASLIYTVTAPDDAPSEGQPTDQRRPRGLLLRDDCGAWLGSLYATRGQGDLGTQLASAFHGAALSIWTKQTGLVTTPPMHISAVLTARSDNLFASVRQEALLSGLLFQCPLVLASDRPAARRDFYGTSGIAEAAASWASAWQDILQGPRVRLFSPEARARLGEWWDGYVRAIPEREDFLRSCLLAAAKIALVLDCLSHSSGEITLATTERALNFVDWLIADLVDALTRYAGITEWHHAMLRVMRYIQSDPPPSRVAVLKNLGIPAKILDAHLEAIMGIAPDDLAGQRARQLRAEGPRKVNT
ncbi:MAG: hypothetical protein JST93_13910 [Acidobacteria bacterium]|nr:hypothetical protein [Acidobacteriota bacterium]